jgi:hypothetical protein
LFDGDGQSRGLLGHFGVAGTLGSIRVPARRRLHVVPLQGHFRGNQLQQLIVIAGDRMHALHHDRGHFFGGVLVAHAPSKPTSRNIRQRRMHTQLRRAWRRGDLICTQILDWLWLA